MPKNYSKWDRISWSIWRNSKDICRKMKGHQQLKKEFQRTGKIKNPPCKVLRIWTKKRRRFWKMQENFESFWSKSLGKIDFFTFLLIISWILTPLRKYIPLEDNNRFLQHFFRFRGVGERSDVPTICRLFIVVYSELYIPNGYSNFSRNSIESDSVLPSSDSYLEPAHKWTC